MTAPVHATPNAWPLLMRMETALAYLDNMDERTFKKICPVQPLDLGANVLRYHRMDLDAWAAGVDHRLPKSAAIVNDVPAKSAPPVEELSATATMSSLDRVRARIEKDKTCRKMSRR